MERVQVKQLVHEAVRDRLSKKRKSIAPHELLSDLFPSDNEVQIFVDTVIQKAKAKGFEVRRNKVPSHGKTTILDVMEALEGELPGGTGKRPPV